MANFTIKTVLLSGVSVLAAQGVLAQDNTDYVELGTVVLYGDRLGQTADEAQGSVAVIGTDQVELVEGGRVEDVFRQAVNVSDGDFTESGFVIRGINSEGLTPGGAGAPLSSFYVDGIQQTVESTRRTIGSSFDVEQVEIYRGPQSTLSGRNALGGAVYVRTRDPEFSRSGAARFSYGSRDHKGVGLAFGDAISDNLAYRISGEYSLRDSELNFPDYQDYPYYDDIKTDEHYTARGKILWLPTGSDSTKVLFTASHGYGAPSQKMVVGSGYNPAVDFDDRRGDLYGKLYPGLGGFPLAIFQDVRDTTTNSFGVELTHEINHNLRFTAQLGVTESTTQRRSVNYGMKPADYVAPTDAFYNVGAFEQGIVSLEARLNYEADGLRWIAGVYGAKEKQDGYRDQFSPSPADPFGPLFLSQTESETDITNLAGFGEVAYDFAPNWTVIAGGRFEHYRRDTTFKSRLSTAGGTTLFHQTNEFDSSETAFIPKIGLSYAFDEGNTLSLIYQEGYRPGGAGYQSNPGAAYTYNPEIARNLELSWRGSLAQDRLKVSANLFYQDWTAQQVEVWETPGDPSTSRIFNAGAAESYGGSLSLAIWRQIS